MELNLDARVGLKKTMTDILIYILIEVILSMLNILVHFLEAADKMMTTLKNLMMKLIILIKKQIMIILKIKKMKLIEKNKMDTNKMEENKMEENKMETKKIEDNKIEEN